MTHAVHQEIVRPVWYKVQTLAHEVLSGAGM